jgi:hypothetical protein
MVGRTRQGEGAVDGVEQDRYRYRLDAGWWVFVALVVAGLASEADVRLAIRCYARVTGPQPSRANVWPTWRSSASTVLALTALPLRL